MLRKLSKLVLKDSARDLPKEQIVRVGRASKVGVDHGNEDEIRVSDSLGGSEDEDELDISEALTSFLSLMPTEQDLFIDQIMFVACFDGHGGPGCAKYLGESLHRKVLKVMRCACWLAGWLAG
jgi:serine/threonine protein phosphatase PrpC